MAVSSTVTEALGVQRTGGDFRLQRFSLLMRSEIAVGSVGAARVPKGAKRAVERSARKCILLFLLEMTPQIFFFTSGDIPRAGSSPQSIYLEVLHDKEV